MFKSVTGRARLLRTHEGCDTSTFDDLLYCCAITVEDSLLTGGATPEKDYQVLDLYKLALPVAMRFMTEETTFTCEIPNQHPHAGLASDLSSNKELQRDILKKLKTHHSYRITPSGMASWSTRTKWSKDQVKRELETMVGDGLVLSWTEAYARFFCLPERSSEGATS